MTWRELSLVLASALLHGAWNVVAKRNASPLAFLFLITLLTTLAGTVCVPLIPWHALTTELAWLIAASGLVHGLTFMALGMAYTRGDLSLVYPISRSTPALVPLVAYLWLGERIGAPGFVGIGLTVVGLWLIHTNGSFRWRSLAEPGAIYAYAVLGLGAAYSVVDKQTMVVWSATAWPSPVSPAITFYLLFTAGAGLVFAPLAWASVGPVKLLASLRRDGWVIAGGAAATLVSYVLILEALETAPVSYVVTVRQLSIVLVLIASVHGLQERPGRLRLVGIAATVAGVTLVGLVG